MGVRKGVVEGVDKGVFGGDTPYLSMNSLVASCFICFNVFLPIQKHFSLSGLMGEWSNKGSRGKLKNNFANCFRRIENCLLVFLQNAKFSSIDEFRFIENFCYCRRFSGGLTSWTGYFKTSSPFVLTCNLVSNIWRSSLNRPSACWKTLSSCSRILHISYTVRLHSWSEVVRHIYWTGHQLLCRKLVSVDSI